jgi:hypothetical protein
MYGSRWKYGQEINYKKIAEEVKRNFTRFGVEYFLNDEEWYAEELAE